MKKVLLSLSSLILLATVSFDSFLPVGQVAASTPLSGVVDPQGIPAKGKATPKAVVLKTESFEKGQKLIAASDCMTCHRVDKKVLGPSYQDIAKKYPNKKESIDYLAGKIIKGGKGVWDQIPMSAHLSISEADAKEMAKYILSLNK